VVSLVSFNTRPVADHANFATMIDIAFVASHSGPRKASRLHLEHLCRVRTERIRPEDRTTEQRAGLPVMATTPMGMLTSRHGGDESPMELTIDIHRFRGEEQGVPSDLANQAASFPSPPPVED
jgi:hypothetical protein